ncbi:hypothetical protein PCANC_16479 [Puccinia coronata f. sp. avenae]|uniref:Uncharacterized protein n=1 Tax=Puccinia coronata f. sp. avenae TaxID=200324 RepID=A0A2N5TGN0_9BASI|nr:hypothetical protein PCANC_16479 [Puccinia coronata f. sp. avenae]PLW24665.1 hypothetical protein PCASD_07546 [Puccinia coronata f. sp. avenae]PLW52277.1 hypothetical protein PCASD_00055 [Puccinia coronata f. sp. avenae]
MATIVPTTIEEWDALRQDVKQRAILTRSSSQTMDLRICAALTLVSGLLYALSFFKRRSRGMWILKKDSEGYWHPNVHTSLPIFAVLYATLDVGAVIFVEKNQGHPIDPVPVALQLAAYQALQIFAWLKIWAVLYACLFSRQRLPVNSIHPSKAQRLVSPRIFNLFNTLIILTVLAGQIPLIYFLYMAIQKFRHAVSATDLSFQLVLDASESSDTDALYDAALQTFVNMRLIKQQAARANIPFKVYTIFITAWMSFNILIYLLSTSFLLHALGSQKNFLTSALENRRALKLLQQMEQEEIDSRHSITSWILQSSPSSPTSSHHDLAKSKLAFKTFDPWTWRSWIDFANDENLNGHVFWDRVHQVNIPLHASRSTFNSGSQADEKNSPIGLLNDAALEKHCSTLIRYWYSTLGQTVIGLGMFLSYLVMAVWLLSRWAHSTGQNDLIEAFVWSNWTWGGGPGILLGIVACIVAFSSTPSLPSDVKAQKSDSRKADIPQRKERDVPYGHTQESQGDGPLEMKNLPVQRMPIQRGGIETQPGQFLKATHHDVNLGVTNSEWGRPSTEFTRSDSSQTFLDRKPSNASTFSSYSQSTFCHDFPSKPPHDNMDWLKTDNVQSEDLVEEEWVGGHFKAIQRLRQGLREDKRFSRSSQRVKSRVL